VCNIALVLCCLAGMYGAISLYTRLRRCPRYLQGLVNRIILRRDFADQNTQFRWFMSATGRSPIGSYVDLSVYQSGDCVEVCTGYIKLDSPKDAQKEFDLTLKMADRVYERTKRADSGGTVTEERAVAHLSPGKYLILKRNGTQIRMITSQSLAYASEFERRTLAAR